jgi:hypothetical protein
LKRPGICSSFQHLGPSQHSANYLHLHELTAMIYLHELTAMIHFAAPTVSCGISLILDIVSASLQIPVGGGLKNFEPIIHE